MCLYPKLIKNRKYIANKKNGGIIPAVSDNRVLLVPVGCGKCMECSKQKSNNWKVRLNEEIKEHKNGQFITLTFSNKELKKLIIEINEKLELTGYELDNKIATLAVRRFLERWRKKYKKSVRHWLCTEIGGNNTERIHLHGIIFTNENEETIEKLWKYGFIKIGNGKDNYVNEKTINYITKYITKIDVKHKEYKPIVLCSSGIGKNYFNRIDYKQNKYNGINTKEYYRTENNKKINLPIYYRNKIYTEDEREKLWLQKLDNNIRYIGGEKVKTDNEEIINKMLKYYRKINNKLGYGNDEINWNRRIYENNLRNLKKIEILKSKN